MTIVCFHFGLEADELSHTKLFPTFLPPLLSGIHPWKMFQKFHRRMLNLRKHLASNVASKIDHFVNVGLSRVLDLYTISALKFFRPVPQRIVAWLIVCSRNLTTVFFVTHKNCDWKWKDLFSLTHMHAPHTHTAQKCIISFDLEILFRDSRQTGIINTFKNSLFPN